MKAIIHNSLLTSTMTLIFGLLLFVIPVEAKDAIIDVETLNVREGPGLNHSQTGQVFKDEVYPVLAEEGNWVQIQYKENKGWVANWLVSIQEKPALVLIEPTVDDLRVRSGPGINYDILGHLRKGDTFPKTGTDGSWLKIGWKETEGWIHEDYVKEHKVSGENPTTDKQMVAVNILNVRKGPSLDDPIVDQLVFGNNVKILSKKQDWYRIEYGRDETGWVASEFLKDPSEEKTATKGTVIVKTPLLNVRSDGALTSKVIDQVKQGQSLPYLKEEKSWYQVKLPNGDIGWVANWLVSKTTEKTNSQQSLTFLYNATNIRNGPSTDYDIVGRGDKGNSYKIIDAHGDWYEIEWKNGTAFVAGWIITTNNISIDQLSEYQGDLTNKIIVIDPGHGGRDTGTIGVDGTYEKTLVLKTALELEKKLKLAGAKVILSRNDDNYLSLSNRSTLSNISNADVFLSLHYNSAPQYPNVKGAGTFYYFSKHKRLATSVHNEIINSTGLHDRNVRFGDFHVIRENSRPSLLLELGFLSNKEEEAYIITNNFQEKVTNGIVKGLASYFNN